MCAHGVLVLMLMALLVRAPGGERKGVGIGILFFFCGWGDWAV